jgi:PST family polysaccharide transporter
LAADPLDQNQRSKLFLTNTLVGLILTIAVALSGPAIAAFYGRDELTLVAAGLAPVFLLNAIAVQFKVELNLKAHWARLATAESVGPIVGLALAIGVAGYTQSYWALVIQPVVASVVQLILAVTLSGWMPTRIDRSSSVRSHLKFGRDTLGLQTFTYVSSNADNVLIGRTLGDAALGEYSRAYQLAIMPITQLASPVTRVILPRLRSSLESSSFNAVAAKLQRILCYTLLTPLSFLIATAGPITAMAFGDNWQRVPELLQVLAFGSMFVAMAYIYYWMFLALQATKTLAFTEGSVRLIMVIAMIAVVSRGPLWVAWCVTLGQILLMIASSTVGWRLLKIDVPALLRATMGPFAVLGSGAAAGFALQKFVEGTPHGLALAECIAAWLLASGCAAVVIPSVRRDLTGYARSALLKVR